MFVVIRVNKKLIHNLFGFLLVLVCWVEVASAFDHCRIRVKREGGEQSVGTQAGIGLQRQGVNAEARRWTRQSQGSSESFLTVSPGYAAFLDVGKDTLAVTCSPRRDGTVLDLEIKSGPESPFAAGPKKSLRTSIRLVPGQWQDLGGIIKSLKNQQNHVGTKGAGLKIRTLEASERVLVSVD